MEMNTTENVGPYIEFKDDSKSFGEHQVLSHVNFSVMPGETVCILGRSGVGKSVSLHLLMGFLKPDSGRVIVAYQDVTDYSEEQMEGIRKKVTMVFQNGALFVSLTVGENVAFPLRERRDLSEEQIMQIVDGLLKQVVNFSLCNGAFGIKLSGGSRKWNDLALRWHPALEDFQVYGRATAAYLPQRFVQNDPRKPRRQARITAELVKTGKRVNIGVLHGVFGLAVVGRDSPSKPV